MALSVLSAIMHRIDPREGGNMVLCHRKAFLNRSFPDSLWSLRSDFCRYLLLYQHLVLFYFLTKYEIAG